MRSRLAVAINVGLALGALILAGADHYEVRRKAMVEEQIAARGVKHTGVLNAMLDVERHRFVPAEYREQAYYDHPLPIDKGETISQPYIVAHMTELLRPEKHHKVLEIGTGSGYQTAVLARLVDHLYSIEIHEELARQADIRLRDLGYSNVTIRAGDGYKGWPEHAPFDRIIVTAAPPQLPEALVEQLKPNGILVAPVGPQNGDQYLMVVTKDAQGQVRRRTATPVRFVPMVPGDSQR